MARTISLKDETNTVSSAPLNPNTMTALGTVGGTSFTLVQVKRYESRPSMAANGQSLFGLDCRLHAHKLRRLKSGSEKIREVAIDEMAA